MDTRNNDDEKFELDLERFKQAVLNQDDQYNKDYLNQVLMYFFDPNKPLPEVNYDFYCEFVQCITGGLSFDGYIKEIEALDSKKRCKKGIHPPNFGFRCKTCSLYITHVLCADCFLNGDHEGHDFTMSASINEGCDCGNPALLSQFCKEHTEINRTSSNYDENSDTIEILKYAEFLLPHFIYRLLQYFRSESIYEEFNSKKKSDDETEEDEDVDKLYQLMDDYIGNIVYHIDLLSKLSNTCDKISSKLSSYLMDEQFYKQKIKDEESTYLKEGSKYSISTIEEKIGKKMALIKYPEEIKNKQLVNIECKCMMDELIIWWIHTFTYDTITVTLLFLKEMNKEYFTKSYISKYCLIDNRAIAALERYNNEQENFNFYFYNDQKILEKSINEYNLIETMMLAIYNQFQLHNLLIDNKNGQDNISTSQVVDYNHRLGSIKGLKIPMRGLYNVLYHSKMGDYLIKNENLLQLWLEMLLHIQGLPITYTSYRDKDSFELENIQSSAIMCVLLNCCTDPSEAHHTISALNKIKESLIKWLDSRQIKGDKEDEDRIFPTYNVPLHRIYAGFLYKAVYMQNLCFKDLIPNDQATLLKILAHPLQIQVTTHVKRKQNYVNKTFSKYFIDADLFLIQCLVCSLEQDVFVKTVLERFQVFETCTHLINNESGDQMVYDSLLFLAQIIQREISLDPFDKDTLRNEVLQMLTCNDCFLSEIEKELPFTRDFKVSAKDIKIILDEIAYVNEPNYTGSRPFESAKYALKEKYWEEEYDPLFYMNYRSVGDKWKVAFKRYSEIVNAKYSCENPTNLIPPFRIPSKIRMESSKLKKKYRIANSRTLHSVLFTLLYSRLNNASLVDDQLFYLVIYLIELAINDIEINGEPAQTSSSSNSDSNNNYLTSDLPNWFDSDNILDNLCKTVTSIQNDKNKWKRKGKKEITVEESMLSMLVKILYKTKTIDKNGVLTVGDDCYALNSLLNKVGILSKKCKQIINDTLAVVENNNQSVTDDDLRDENANAMERERIVLRQKFKKLKKDQNDSGNVKPEEEMDTTSNLCAFCLTPAVPSLDRPVGFSCQAEYTIGLGLWNSSKENKKIGEVLTTTDTTFSPIQQNRTEILLESFKTESCKESINIGYKGSAIIHSCGDVMHFDCIFDKMSENDSSFTCGLCAKKGNLVLPIKPNSQTKSSSVIKRNEKALTKYICDALQTEHLFDIKYLKTMFFCENTALERIYEVVPSEHRYIDRKHDSKLSHFYNDSDETLFLVSLIRTQLEVKAFKKKKEKYSNTNRLSFLSLFDLVSTRCKVICFDKKKHLKAWNLLHKPVSINNEEEVPVLLRDPISLFLLIVLNLPFETATSQDVFARIVNSAFNLAYFQSLLMVVLQMTDEQRTSTSRNEFNSIGNYLSFIVSHLNKLPADNNLSIEDLKGANNYTDFKLYLQELCLPFLRVASLLQYYLFGKECDEKDSFNSYINNLEIHFKEEDPKEPLLKWYDADSTAILTSWMQELLTAFNLRSFQIKELLSIGKYIYTPPDLVEFPYLYTDLIKNYLNRSIESSDTDNPTDICLICGKYVSCDYYSDDHMNECCVNVGLFFRIQSTEVTIYTKENRIFWGSIYVDEYGEEDQYLARGKQMYLSKDRYSLLKETWLCNYFI